MKIIHINTSDNGGAAIGAIRIHKALLEIGVNSNILFYKQCTVDVPNANGVEVVYPNLKQRILKKFGLNLTPFEKEIQKINLLGKPFSQGGTFELFSSPYSEEIELHNHPLVKEADIINLHWISGFVDLPSFITKINKPIVWTIHDMNPFLGGFHYDIDMFNNPKLAELENQYRSLKKELFSHKKYAIVGNSAWITEQTIASKQFENATAISTIYYPLNLEDFRAIDKSIAKICLKLPSDKLIIGFACEDLKNPRKGFDILLKALSLLNKEEKEKICCLSFGKENRAIDNIEGLDVIQLGTIQNSKIQSIAYSAMDFFIIPSKAEAFGLTALEAMACKTPIIGSVVGGIVDMVLDDVTGYLFNPTDVKSLVPLIKKVLTLPKEKRMLLGENANNLVAKKHNPELIASNYIKLYTSLLT